MNGTTLYLYYYDNYFTDEDGKVIYDIFTLITPQDLFMFRQDPLKYNCFPMKRIRGFFCEITIPDELYELLEQKDTDFGDDSELMTRYLKAKESGFFY